MTSTEMVRYFSLRYEQNSFTNDDLQTEEKVLYINAAINRFIKTRFTGNNPRGVPFEGDQKRVDDLRTLMKVGTKITSFGTPLGISNAKNIALPADYLYYVSGIAEMTNNDYDPNSSEYSCDVINHNQLGKFIKTGRNKPIIINPKVILRETGYVTLIYDPTATLTGFYFTYIKAPAVVVGGSVDCDLPTHTHEEIVDLAVKLSLDDTADLRGQLSEKNLQTIE
jgi:hypothetical protein